MEMNTMTKNNKPIISGLVAASFLTLPVSAQETGFSAEVDSRLTYDDNILRTAKVAEQSDTSLVVSPELDLAGILGKQRFSITYNGEYAKYFDNRDVDYVDHNILIRADLDHSYRLTSRFDVQYQDKHEDLTDSSQIYTNFSEFNHFVQKDIAGRLTYGRKDSSGQLVTSLGHSQKDFDNNGQEFRNYDADIASLAFYYRIGARTRLLSLVVYQDYKYEQLVGQTSFDNKYVRYLVGGEWSVTNKIDASLKVGYQNRSYAVDGLNDTSGLAYDAKIKYLPNTYSSISFSAKRAGIDSGQEDSNGYVRSSYDLSGSHNLNELTKVGGQLYYAVDDGILGSVRKDKRIKVQFGIRHTLTYWVEIGANVRHEKRDSTIDLADYSANSINLTANFTFN
jgi:hypothetical protein